MCQPGKNLGNMKKLTNYPKEVFFCLNAAQNTSLCVVTGQQGVPKRWEIPT
jgi:hypothetical protein